MATLRLRERQVLSLHSLMSQHPTLQMNRHLEKLQRAVLATDGVPMMVRRLVALAMLTSLV